MKIAAIIPVKTFSNAKTRLKLPSEKIEELCKVMLEEILQTLSISPQIDKIILITKEEKAIELGKKFKTITIIDQEEKSVNEAVSLADKYLLENDYNASIVFPQDIPFIKTQDIDFMLRHQLHPNFVIIVPSRKFDGTYALVSKIQGLDMKAYETKITMKNKLAEEALANFILKQVHV